MQTLSKVVRGQVKFHESICNAGLIALFEGYVCVAKNQKFSYCDELGTSKGREPAEKGLDDGVRVLYRIDTDLNWKVKSIRKLRVVVDDRSVDPIVFIEDVRLVVHKGSIVAFANSKGAHGAWPLLGTLEKEALLLRSVVADFSAPQKNWMPFEYGERLYLEYSIEPHVILKFDMGSARCTEAYCTSLESDSVPDYLHGGAPPLRLNDDYFLGVGNSQHLYWFQDRYYAAVFYLFEARPPFRVIKVSPPLRVQSRLERIHYICGLAFGADKQSLILSVGICDCDNRFVVVSLDKILALFK